MPVILDHPQTAALRAAGVRAVGVDHRAPDEVWGEGLRPTYLFFYVAEGVVASADDSARAHAGEMLCVPPKALKRLQTMEGPLVATYIHLAAFAPWTALAEEGYQVYAARHAALLREAVTTLGRETLSGTAAAGTAAEQLCQLVLHYALQLVQQTESPQDQATRLRLVDLWHAVGDELDHDWTVAALAARAAMSPGHFHREVRRLFGQRPMQIVRRLRMERVAALLKTTALDLAAIADEVGYSTAYALSNAFLRHTGTRPGHFRRTP